MPEACIFVDDGISGAEFANRTGFVRLIAALKPRPPFQVLVMSEESRLGREAIETAYALKQLITAGVRVWFYLEDRERTLDSPTDKIMLSLATYADELEREKARQRTYDAMQRKAKAGHVTGGACFGYDNVEVLGPNGQRSHVERRINEAEAAIVRRLFALCADGAGLTRITKTLNAEGVPLPRAQRGRPQAWATSSVRAVLRRPLYAGEVVWNRSRKRDRWGGIASTLGRLRNGCTWRGGDVETLARIVGRLQGLQSRRATLTSTRTARPAIASPELGRGLEARLRAKLADWRGLLTRNVESGREVLKTLLVEPFRFTPEIDARGRRYRFTGAIALDRLVAGVIDLKTCDRVTSPGEPLTGGRCRWRGFSIGALRDDKKTLHLES